MPGRGAAGNAQGHGSGNQDGWRGRADYDNSYGTYQGGGSWENAGSSNRGADYGQGGQGTGSPNGDSMAAAKAAAEAGKQRRVVRFPFSGCGDASQRATQLFVEKGDPVDLLWTDPSGWTFAALIDRWDKTTEISRGWLPQENIMDEQYGYQGGGAGMAGHSFSY